MTETKHSFEVTWLDRGREPQEKPDPKYPKGKDLDISLGAALSCIVKLPYPAPRCGLYIVTCGLCGVRNACTTAGRVDDPRSLRMACKLRGSETLQ